MVIDFVDARQKAREHPDTYHVVSVCEQASLKPGDLVKVSTCGERFWAEVQSIDGDTITGQITNHLVLEEYGLKFGDVITFEKRHIHDTEAQQWH